MIIYISVRPIRLGSQVISPKEQLKHSFPDIPLTFTSLGIDLKVDGRMLYEINFSGTDEHKTEILAGLSMWGAREITVEEAKAIAATISKREWTDDGAGKLIPPDDEPPKPSDTPK